MTQGQWTKLKIQHHKYGNGGHISKHSPIYTFSRHGATLAFIKSCISVHLDTVFTNFFRLDFRCKAGRLQWVCQLKTGGVNQSAANWTPFALHNIIHGQYKILISEAFFEKYFFQIILILIRSTYRVILYWCRFLVNMSNTRVVPSKPALITRCTRITLGESNVFCEANGECKLWIARKMTCTAAHGSCCCCSKS